MSGSLIPLNYKGIDVDNDETISLGKYPTFAWSNDAYTNWLTQQAVNIPTQIVGTGLNAIGQFVSGNVVGGISTLAGTTANLIGQSYSASLLPMTTSGQNTADVNFSAAKTTFTAKAMRCRDEYLEIIDNFFTRYGYKINELKVPNLTGRTYWNFIEIGQNEILCFGDIPNIYEDKINEIARRGVTIWHDHDNIGDYSLTNSIVT